MAVARLAADRVAAADGVAERTARPVPDAWTEAAAEPVCVELAWAEVAAELAWAEVAAEVAGAGLVFGVACCELAVAVVRGWV